MRAETWARVSALFDEALRLAPAERATLLERVSTDAPEVRAEVERLLALDARAGASFEADSVFSGAVWTPAPGARIGHYTLVRTIASGGMGTVYEARQEGLQRSVALKTLRLGLVTPQRRQRFQFEVEALSRLQHPGIAQVYEYGLHREGELELPFFAMELVEGARDLLSFARGQDLSADARLALFVAVCDAVQHGHQRGVIHRDLKPSNVLVDAAGQPKVIDFGVARLAREGEHGQTLTLPGQIVGTLQYMSPEQLAGKAAEADTQSDVYALGVILHELLTGRLPYELGGLSLAQAARLMAEAEPARPKELPLELGWIVLKCLAREPARRYASAAELKGDLERYLAHEPVLAGPPGAGYRLRKLIRRQRLPLAAAAAVLAALAFGLVRAEREARAAMREARKAESITAFLEQTLTSSSLFERGPDVRVVEMLEDSAPKVQAELASQPEAQAMVDFVIGKSFLGLWRFEEAGQHLDAAWSYAEEHLPKGDPLRLEMLAYRVRYLSVTGQFDLCEQLGREAEPLALEHLGPLDKTTLLIQGTLAEMMLTLTRSEEAERRYDEIIPKLTEVYGPEHGEVIAYRGGRAMVWSNQGRFEEARQEFERVYELAQEALASGHFRTINAANNLANVLIELGEFGRAEGIGREAIAQIESTLGPDHRLLWLPYFLCGRAVIGQGRTAEGIQDLLHAVESTGGTTEIERCEAALVRAVLATAYLEFGDRAAAEEQFRASEELRGQYQLNLPGLAEKLAPLRD